MNVQGALKSQYHAALAMVKDSIDRCPDDLWTGGEWASEFWQVAYHTLFFTHLYLQPDEKAFRPWEHHREEYQCLETLPWPPHRPPNLGEPYTKQQVLEYWALCDAMIDGGVQKLDLDANECGFWWYRMPKLDHQIMNIRHVQHHAAQLAGRRLRAGLGEGDWVGPGPGPAK
jgi:hypothetical protein